MTSELHESWDDKVPNKLSTNFVELIDYALCYSLQSTKMQLHTSRMHKFVELTNDCQDYC